MKSDYYVYIYLDPRKSGNYIYDNLKFDFEPFYVGKGKNNRIIQGFNDPNNSESKQHIIKEIKKIGLKPISMKIYENLSENISYELEKLTIKKIGRNTLVNKSKGSTSYKKVLSLYKSKCNNDIIVNVIGIAFGFYFINDGSYFKKDLFFKIFKK